MSSTGYNFVHAQVAERGVTPVYKDVNYSTTFEPTISQDSNTLLADGKAVVVAMSAKTGEGSAAFAAADLDTIAILTGEEVSTTGTAGTVIDRLEIHGATVAPGCIYSGWIPNVDANTAATSAGLRVTVPNGKFSVPSGTFGQEEWTEFTSDIAFVPDDNDVMIIFEDMVTAPVFTSGVMPVNLVPPA